MNWWARSRGVPLFVAVTGAVTVLAVYTRFRFYFPDLLSGRLVDVPLVLVVALLPPLTWVALTELSLNPIASTMVRKRLVSAADWVGFCGPVALAILALSLAGTPDVQAFARNLALFMALAAIGLTLAQPVLAFGVPVLWLLTSCAVGGPIGNGKPAPWAFILELWDTERDAYVTAAALMITVVITLGPRRAV